VRLKRAGLTVGMSFEAPLTQELIGDALGLTAIHVNRTLRCLRQDKLVAMDGKKVTIVDFEALSLQSDFENSYLGENARALWTRRTVQKPCRRIAHRVQAGGCHLKGITQYCGEGYEDGYPTAAGS